MGLPVRGEPALVAQDPTAATVALEILMENAHSLLLVLAAVALGCSGGPGEPDAGEAPDASQPADGGQPDPDVDGGATPDDADDDGVPTASDCDDADPGVGESAERECSTECGDGTERCAMGVWGDCDAPTECLCDTPGTMRITPCGRCGMQSERCSDDGRWESVSECLNQGECDVAEVETRMTDLCGTEQRLCDSSCMWGEWSEVVPDGECEPGDLAACSSDSGLFLHCDETCHWETECRPI
jgi:hypothetical protein